MRNRFLRRGPCYLDCPASKLNVVRNRRNCGRRAYANPREVRHIKRQYEIDMMSKGKILQVTEKPREQDQSQERVSNAE